MSNGSRSKCKSVVPSEDEDNTPLWRFVTKLEKVSDNGGNWLFECSFCNSRFKGSYSRVKAHLLRLPNQGIKICDKAPTGDRSKLKKLYIESEARAILKFRSQSEPKKRKLPVDGKAVEKSKYTKGQGAVLDALIARSFYSQGLSFNMARNPYCLESYMYAANHKLSGYVPPNYNQLRTTLLDKEKANIENLFQPVRFRWGEQGVTIVCNGWSDLERRSQINFFAVSDSVPMFLKAVKCDGLVMDMDQIASIIRGVILEVGASNVVQVITENIPACESAGRVIEEKFSTVYWSPCMVHALDLALKDICMENNTELNEVLEIIHDVLLIRDFILSQPICDNLFKKVPNLKMLTIAETRFAFHVVLLRRFREIRTSLLSTVMDDDTWSSYVEGDADSAEYVKEKIVSDEWWDSVNFIISFTEPIYEMMKICDTVEPTLHLICGYWEDMLEKVRESIYLHEKLQYHDALKLYNTVHSILVSRRAKSHAPLHCLVHSLNPRYYSKEWLEEEEGRVAPHRDATISKERDNCLKRYFPDPVVRYTIISQFGDFAGCAGDFASFDSQSARGLMDARKWWVVYGVGAPQLQSLALKLLGHPTSSSCCEKNWSTYSFIQSLEKNPMDPTRAEDLIFVHNNLRLLSRKSSYYNQGETKMWDIAGDAFDLSEKGLMEIANLSLDEPEMERAFFMDEPGGAGRVLMLNRN